jgi:hypothetical protein
MGCLAFIERCDPENLRSENRDRTESRLLVELLTPERWGEVAGFAVWRAQKADVRTGIGLTSCCTFSLDQNGKSIPLSFSFSNRAAANR